MLRNIRNERQKNSFKLLPSFELSKEIIRDAPYSTQNEIACRTKEFLSWNFCCICSTYFFVILDGIKRENSAMNIWTYVRIQKYIVHLIGIWHFILFIRFLHSIFSLSSSLSTNVSRDIHIYCLPMLKRIDGWLVVWVWYSSGDADISYIYIYIHIHILSIGFVKLRQTNFSKFGIILRSSHFRSICFVCSMFVM